MYIFDTNEYNNNQLNNNFFACGLKKFKFRAAIHHHLKNIRTPQRQYISIGSNTFRVWLQFFNFFFVVFRFQTANRNYCKNYNFWYFRLSEWKDKSSDCFCCTRMWSLYFKRPEHQFSVVHSHFVPSLLLFR